MKARQRMCAAMIVTTVAMVGGAPATADPSFGTMTMSGWDGVHLGQSIPAVARRHGWAVNDPGCGVVNTGTRGVEVAGDVDAGRRVRTISIFRKSIAGPHGLRVGRSVSTISGLLDRGTQHVYDAGDEGSWTYWLIHAHPGFLWVRADDNVTVRSFGLAANRAEAVDRSTTIGGCY